MRSESSNFRRPLIALALGCALCAPSMGAHAQSSIPTSKPALQSMTVSRDPEKLGFSKARLDRLGGIFEEKISSKMWPGSVSIIARNGHLVHFEAHGTMDPAGSRPMRKDSIFRVMSMTKPVVAVAAMTLVEKGVLNLDDPVERYLPELKGLKVANPTNPSAPIALERSIIIYDLLRHASGLVWARAVEPTRPAYVRDIAKAYEAADLQPGATNQTPEEFLTKLAAIPLAYQPGTVFDYGISSDVLGVVLERVSGQRLDQFVKKTIFEPLKMKDSDWYVPQDKLGRLADAFDQDPMKAAVWRNAPPEPTPGPAIRYAGGGMFSTAQDYFRFAQMVLNGGELDGVRVLSPKTLDFMMVNHIQGLGGSPAAISGSGYGYGLGFGVRLDLGGSVVPGSVGDAYWPGISGTSFTVDRKEGLVALYLVQAPSNRISARHMFKDVVYSTMLHRNPQATAD